MWQSGQKNNESVMTVELRQNDNSLQLGTRNMRYILLLSSLLGPAPVERSCTTFPQTNRSAPVP